MPRIVMFTPTIQPHHAHEWAMSRTWMSRVTQLNEACHAYTLRCPGSWCRPNNTPLSCMYYTHGLLTPHISHTTHRCLMQVLDDDCDADGVTWFIHLYDVTQPYGHATHAGAQDRDANQNTHTHTHAHTRTHTHARTHAKTHRCPRSWCRPSGFRSRVRSLSPVRSLKRCVYVYACVCVRESAWVYLYIHIYVCRSRVRSLSPVRSLRQCVGVCIHI